MIDVQSTNTHSHTKSILFLSAYRVDRKRIFCFFCFYFRLNEMKEISNFNIIYLSMQNIVKIMLK